VSPVLGVPPPLFVNLQTTCALVAIWTLGRVDLDDYAARVGEIDVSTARWNLQTLLERGLVTVSRGVVKPDLSHPYSRHILALANAFADRYSVEPLAREAGAAHLTSRHRPGSADIFGGGGANEMLIILAACGVCFARPMLEVAPTPATGFARRLNDFEIGGIVRIAQWRSYRLVSLDPGFFAASQLRSLLNAIIARDRPQYRARAHEHAARWPVLTDKRALRELGWS